MSFGDNSEGSGAKYGAKAEDSTENTILAEIQKLSRRIETLEFKVGQAAESSVLHPGHAVGSQQPQLTPNRVSENISLSAPTPSVDAEYQRVRNTVQSVRLPPFLTLQESRQGVKREDLPLFNILTKCARHAETTLKLCANTEGDSHEEVFNVMYSLIKFLQDEYAALVVGSTFDTNVSKVFRSLQKNTGFTPEQMEHLRSAATIAAAYRPQSPARGRGRGFGRQPFQQQQSRDLFQRGFPRRGGSNSNSGSNQPPQSQDNSS